MKDMKMGKGDKCAHKPSKLAPPFEKRKGKAPSKKGKTAAAGGGAKPNPFANLK